MVETRLPALGRKAEPVGGVRFAGPVLKSVNFLQFEGEEMKKIILAMCLSMAVVMVVTPAFAEELWDYHLRGVDEGLAAGAVPPPGFYFIHELLFFADLTFF